MTSYSIVSPAPTNSCRYPLVDHQSCKGIQKRKPEKNRLDLHGEIILKGSIGQKIIVGLAEDEPRFIVKDAKHVAYK